MGRNIVAVLQKSLLRHHHTISETSKVRAVAQLFCKNVTGINDPCDVFDTSDAITHYFATMSLVKLMCFIPLDVVFPVQVTAA